VSDGPVSDGPVSDGPVSDGLVIVDKPAGLTSHDVVARIRRLAGTRRVGHAGTLDPMATGLLVVGVNRATRLLGHLVLTEKEYTATIRLGQATVTDDAEGAVLSSADAAAVPEAAIRTAMAGLTGEIEQVPSAVSAIKVGGRRSYARVRAGESVTLPARPVTIGRFDALAIRRADGVTDVDVGVECSSGTYVRALARDLGAALGVGGHLTALRRTRVGPFTEVLARTLDDLADGRDPVSVSLADAIAMTMRVRPVTAAEARSLTFGRSLPPAGIAGIYGAVDPTGAAVALLSEDGATARPVVVFTVAP
jgi:tRNA pseudouridine55 synthase